jgi:tetratricopeptide (TPR) repeat protein
VEARSNKSKFQAQLNVEKQAFQQKSSELSTIRQQYENIGPELHQKLVNLEKNSRQRQLERFLDSYDIYDARIPGIGEQRKATLISYGIETAADVHYSKIQGIVPGFGPANASKLVTWRQALEGRFVFDSSKGIDPADKQAIEQEIALKRKTYEADLSGGPVRLKQIVERITYIQEQIRKDIELNAKDIDAVQHKLEFLFSLKKGFVPLWGIMIALAVWWFSLTSSPLGSQIARSTANKPVQSANPTTPDNQQRPVERNTELAASFYEQGVGYTRSKQFEKAAELYLKAIKTDPDYAEAYHELGYALLRLNHYDEAIAACQRSIQLRPTFADTYRNLAKCYSAKGEVDNQISALKVAVKLAPNHIESVYQLAEMLFQKEEYREAATHYIKIIKLNPKLDKAWYRLGIIFGRIGEAEKANEVVDQLRDLNPNLADSLAAELARENK